MTQSIGNESVISCSRTTMPEVVLTIRHLSSYHDIKVRSRLRRPLLLSRCERLHLDLSWSENAGQRQTNTDITCIRRMQIKEK